MAQYGRIRIVVQNSSGEPVSGASVEIRKQGATVNGVHAGATTSFTVNDPGAITTAGTADNLQVGTDNSVTRSVSSFTATNVTVGGAGFSDVQDDARLTVVNNLPTLYNDAQGAETKANPLTTDSNGVAVCWASVVPYDVKVSGSGITTQLLQDEVPVGNERIISNVHPGAGPAFIFDTSRVLSTDDKIISVRENAVEKFSVDDDGDVVGAKGTFSGAVAGTTGTFSGNVSAGGTLSVTGASTVAAISATTGNFSGTITGVAATLSGNVNITGLTSIKRLQPTHGTAHVTGDYALSAGWGTTASLTIIIGTSNNDTRGSFRVTSSGTGQAANPTVTLTLKDGTEGATTYPVFVTAKSSSSQPSVVWSADSTATAVVFTFHGTPVAAQVLEAHYLIISP